MVRGTGLSGVWVQEQQHTNVYPIQGQPPNFTKHFIKIKILQFQWNAAIKKTNKLDTRPKNLTNISTIGPRGKHRN